MDAVVVEQTEFPAQRRHRLAEWCGEQVAQHLLSDVIRGRVFDQRFLPQRRQSSKKRGRNRAAQERFWCGQAAGLSGRAISHLQQDREACVRVSTGAFLINLTRVSAEVYNNFWCRRARESQVPFGPRR